MSIGRLYSGCARFNDRVRKFRPRGVRCNLMTLKVSISQWFNTGNLTGEGEVPYVNAPGTTRVIPPENIPKQATQGTKEPDQGDRA